MNPKNEQRHLCKEALSASEARRRLRKNYEELIALMESDYLDYLAPETIARIQAIVGKK